MRLNINLASQPYEAARRFAIQWGSIIAVLSLVTIGLVGIAASSYMRSRPVIKQRHELEAKIAELDREKRTAEDKLNLPGNLLDTGFRRTREADAGACPRGVDPAGLHPEQPTADPP
jgi:hypothetical protein